MARLRALLRLARLSDRRAWVVKRSRGEMEVEILAAAAAVYFFARQLKTIAVAPQPARLLAAQWTVTILAAAWALLPLTVNPSIPTRRLLIYPFTKLERRVYWMASILQRRRFAAFFVASLLTVFACLRLPHPLLAALRAAVELSLAAGAGLLLAALLSNFQNREFFRRKAAPPATGQRFPLWRKELRYYGRTLDFYIALIVSIAAALSECFGRWLTPGKATVPFLLLALLQMPAMLNPFGLDGARQIDRYRLFPVRYRELLEQKHLALTTLFVASALPLIAAIAWKSSFADSCSAALRLALVMASWLLTGLLLMHTQAAREIRMAMGSISGSDMSLLLALISAALLSAVPLAVVLAQPAGAWRLLAPLGALCVLAAIYLLALRRQQWPTPSLSD